MATVSVPNTLSLFNQNKPQTRESIYNYVCSVMCTMQRTKQYT